jgi:hypothetical protein
MAQRRVVPDHPTAERDQAAPTLASGCELSASGATYHLQLSTHVLCMCVCAHTQNGNYIQKYETSGRTNLTQYAHLPELWRYGRCTSVVRAYDTAIAKLVI